MANPTRYTRLGIGDAPTAIRNKGDYFIQTLTAPVTIVASTAAQTTTTQLPPRCLVESVVLNVTTAESTGTTQTIDIGLSTGGAADLANDISVASTGFVAGLQNVVGDAAFLTYSLGSTDYAELEAEIVVKVIGSQV